MERHELISAPQLIAGLLEYKIVPAAVLDTLLGATRDSITLNELELSLVRQHLVSADRILELKGAITGLGILDDYSITVRPSLLASVVRATGAFVLERNPLTVAMIENTPGNIDALSEELGTTNFDIWLITGPQFDTLYETYYSGAEDEDILETKNVEELLDEALRRSASDLHLSVGKPPAIRADGGLVYLPRQPLTQEWFARESPTLVGPEKYALVTTTYDVDAAYSYGDARFRVNVGADYNGDTIALRRIPARVPLLDEIGVPPGARALCNLDRGLVLVTGPTGSGKSTTLAAMLSFIAMNMARHIITLEDPIEFYLPTGKSVVNQREMGSSFATFPAGLRQALRQDPDVILVGELRDLDTMRTALTAAETGHLVFGTLHTFDAASTVARLVSSFPAEEQSHARAQLASILKGIIAQTLLPRSTQKGRVAAFEVLLANTAARNNLSKIDGHNSLHQIIETSSRDGMLTMESSLASLVRQGLVREDEARFRAPDREAFDRILQAYNTTL
jgi:twitching motility protein PilT